MLSDLPCDSTAPYILGMLLSGEFDSPAVKLQKDVVPLNIDEAKWRIERSAYLSFGPAQYKMVRSTRFRMSDSKLGSAFYCLPRCAFDRDSPTSTLPSDASSTLYSRCSTTPSPRRTEKSRPTWVSAVSRTRL
jgi:hypothetical protein